MGVLAEETACKLRNHNYIIGVGPIRTASTWLHTVFEATGEVEVTRRKEIEYFDRYYYKGPSWYNAQFLDRGRQTRVDITPEYIGSDLACSRIMQELPNATILITLRDPIERARSAMKLLEFVYNKESVDSIIDRFNDIIKSQFLIARRVSALRDAYSERLIPILYTEISLDSRKAAQYILSRCGLSAQAPAVSELTIHSLHRPKNTIPTKLAKGIFDMAKPLLSTSSRESLKATLGHQYFMTRAAAGDSVGRERLEAVIEAHKDALLEDYKAVCGLLST